MKKAKDFRHSAASKMSGNWGILILSTILVAILVGAASCTGIGALIVTGPFSVGLIAVFLITSRGMKPDVGNIFDGFRNCFGNSLLAAILVGIFEALWSLLFIIPGIIKYYSYAMTFYILADNPNMSALDAITESRKMMDGNKWRLFCLELSFIGWDILSCFTLGILQIWILPYKQMAITEFYEDIKPQVAQAPNQASYVDPAQQNNFQ